MARERESHKRIWGSPKSCLKKFRFPILISGIWMMKNKRLKNSSGTTEMPIEITLKKISKQIRRLTPLIISKLRSKSSLRRWNMSLCSSKVKRPRPLYQTGPMKTKILKNSSGTTEIPIEITLKKISKQIKRLTPLVISMLRSKSLLRWWNMSLCSTRMNYQRPLYETGPIETKRLINASGTSEIPIENLFQKMSKQIRWLTLLVISKLRSKSSLRRLISSLCSSRVKRPRPFSLKCPLKTKRFINTSRKSEVPSEIPYQEISKQFRRLTPQVINKLRSKSSLWRWNTSLCSFKMKYPRLLSGKCPMKTKWLMNATCASEVPIESPF